MGRKRYEGLIASGTLLTDGSWSAEQKKKFSIAATKRWQIKKANNLC